MGLGPIVPKSPQGQRSQGAFSLSSLLPSFPSPPPIGLKAKLAGIGPTIGLDASPFSLELPPGKMGRGGGEYDRMADGLRGQEGESHQTGASCTEPGRGQGEKLMGVE